MLKNLGELIDEMDADDAIMLLRTVGKTLLKHSEDELDAIELSAKAAAMISYWITTKHTIDKNVVDEYNKLVVKVFPDLNKDESKENPQNDKPECKCNCDEITITKCEDMMDNLEEMVSKGGCKSLKPVLACFGWLIRKVKEADNE